MKIWSSTHVYDESWELVVRAQFRKYPNKFNQAVEGVDTVDRTIDKNGVLHSHRLMSTRWGFPDWATKILGTHGHCYASELSWVIPTPKSKYMVIYSKNILGTDNFGYGSEHSSVDPNKKTMEMKSRNLTFCNVINIEEKMVYTPHPEDKSKTVLKQQAVITVKGVPLGSYLESYVADSINKNAANGRMAMQSVMENLKQETLELQQEARIKMHNVEEAFKNIHLGDHML